MVLVEGCSGILLLAAWCCMPGGGALGPGLLLVPPTPCPPLATSAHVGEGVGEGGGWVLLLLAISPSLVPPFNRRGGGGCAVEKLLLRTSRDQCTQHTGYNY